jgi:protein-S-isoprenylcysteine O-methyltransferase Ste14
VIVVPGARLVSAGPYRYVRHPNYIAVFGELLGAALMTGAAVAGPLAVASFAFLIGRRIRVETRALAAAHCDEVAKSPKNHIPGRPVRLGSPTRHDAGSSATRVNIMST